VSKEQPWSQDFFLKADEGTRTLDLLHGKPAEGGDARQPTTPHGNQSRMVTGLR
jgi:hypothetical protein